MSLLSEEERLRYSRQLLGVGFSPDKQERLKSSRVLVAGVGGLGGVVATYLTCAGVGRLVIVHPGELELPDLNRQTLMYSHRIGEVRVEIARDRLGEINPEVYITAVNERIHKRNIASLVSGVDMVVDCRHNFKERYLLNQTCVQYGKIMIEGAMDDLFGYLTTIFPGRTPCLSCLYPQSPPEWDKLGFPVLGAIPGILGGLMALEVIKIISGVGEPLYSRLLTFDGRDMEFRSLTLRRDPHCEVCGDQKED